MTNARSTTKFAGGWWLLTVPLVLGLLAAAPLRASCINDEQGPDDQPGQKDLSGLCEPGPTCSSSTLSLRWQFDDLTWTGRNPGDACALIDTNRDGLADRA